MGTERKEKNASRPMTGGGGKIPRTRTFPNALTDAGIKHTESDLARRIAELKESAKNLVTLNVEINTCKLCPHKYSCVQNAVYKGLFRSFAAGYMFKTLLAFLGAILSGKLGRKGRTVKEIFWGQDALRFAQFIGVMSFLYKAVLCSLRRNLNKTSLGFHFIAGFISGIQTEQGEREREMIERKKERENREKERERN
ncbi:hypothetical protein AAMO2058_001412100 [Amorphochlora amoebiformis]